MACPFHGITSSIAKDDGFLAQFAIDDTDCYTTTDFGTRVNDTRSLKAGERGPTLLEDFTFRTKIMRFDHERVPERVVHARGAGAHGHFESYKNWSDLTCASFLSEEGKTTPMFVRFSTVNGSRGAPDTLRDIHGFALRFYTDEGNFDIVGNNTPVFFIQDAIQFPDLIHALKPEPNNEIPQQSSAHDSAYDFLAHNPSSLHNMLWLHSGHGIPRSYRHMNGFGVNTFRLVNAEGQSKLVKFHYRSEQGLASLIWPEAMTVAGQNPDYHRQDLYESIESGAFPSWELCVQIVDEEDAVGKYSIDLLDATKILPEEEVPLTPLGRFTLNRNPRDFFAETEQIMFCVGHVVPGIDFSEDPLLQGRLFSYTDTQLNRSMGSPNFEKIPINMPRNGIHNNHRDGAMQTFIHTNKHPYTYNTLNGGHPQPAFPKDKGFASARIRKVIDGQYVQEISPTFLDYWTQPRLFWNSLHSAEQQMVVNSLRFELSRVQILAVREKMVEQLNMISNDLATRVAKAINVAPPSPTNTKYYHDRKTTGISVFENPLKTIAGLKVGILTTINSSSSLAQATIISEGLLEKEAQGIVIAENLIDGVHASYLTSDASLFDAIVITSGTDLLFDPAFSSVSSDFPSQRPLNIVRDAFFYGKTVASVGTAKAFRMISETLVERPGVFVRDKWDSTFLDQLEQGLKQFKFVDRFPSDK